MTTKIDMTITQDDVQDFQDYGSDDEFDINDYLDPEALDTTSFDKIVTAEDRALWEAMEHDEAERLLAQVWEPVDFVCPEPKTAELKKVSKTVEPKTTPEAKQVRLEQTKDPRIMELEAWIISKGLSTDVISQFDIDGLYAEMKIQQTPVPVAEVPRPRNPQPPRKRKERQVMNAKGKVQGVKQVKPVIAKEKVVPTIVPKPAEAPYQPEIDFEEDEYLPIVIPVREPTKVEKVVPVAMPVAIPLLPPPKPVQTQKIVSMPAPVPKRENAPKDDEWQTVRKPEKKPKVEAPKPAYNTHGHGAPKFTRMCRSVLTGTKCYHQNCFFAHDVSQLVHTECGFGHRCAFARQRCTGVYENSNPQQRICSFWHPNETTESYARRNGLPMPKTVSKPNQPSFQPKKLK